MNLNKLIKTSVALSLLAVIGASSTSNAQDNKTKAAATTAKVFGGRPQYRTWSVGLHAGALAPTVITGSSDVNGYSNWEMNMGYGIAIRKQLAHSFGIELNGLRGILSGSNKDATGGERDGLASFKTTMEWSVNLMGVVNVATVDFLNRENSVNFLVKAGYGMTRYSNNYVLGGTNVSVDNGSHTVKQIPVGVGVKFKVSDRVNFDLGHNMYFVDGNDLTGKAAGTFAANSPRASAKDRFSYTYVGVELALGAPSKPNLDWANPVAMMYDELKDQSIRRELDSLKKHVAEQDKQVAEHENRINELLKDSDSDGVTDKFDKCPNTEAGVKVDGSGCPICPLNCPTKNTLKDNAGVSKAGSIQFEYDSSVLKTSSYPALDQLSSDIKAKVYSSLQLDGYASIEGTPEYNMQLSIDRANSVKTFLVNSGVPANKINVKGYGTENPIASNDTEDGRIKNRRVEIKKNK